MERAAGPLEEDENQDGYTEILTPLIYYGYCKISFLEFLSRPKSIKFATAGPSSYISGSPSTGLFSEAGVLMNTARPQTDSEYRDPITAVHLNINNFIQITNKYK